MHFPGGFPREITMTEGTGKVFEYTLTIQEIDLDSFGHLNNAVYLRLFEQARWEFITQHGYGIEKIQSTGLGPVILDVHLRFLKELRAREKVVIKSQAVSFQGKIGKIKQWMEKENTVCAEALFTIGFWDIRQRKLVSATPDWLACIGL